MDIRLKQEIVNAEIGNVNGIENRYEDSKQKAAAAAEPFFSNLDSDEMHLWITNLAAKSGAAITSLDIGDAKVAEISTLPSSGFDISYPIKDYAGQVNGNNSTHKTVSNSKAAGGKSKVLESDVTVSLQGGYANAKALLDAIIQSGKTAYVSNFDYTSNQTVPFDMLISLPQLMLGVKLPLP